MAKQKRGADSAPETPYTSARREWNERYGDYIAQAFYARVVAVISLILLGFSIAGMAYVGAQSKVMPFIVKEKNDEVLEPLGYATKAPALNEKLVRLYLIRLVEDSRRVSPDFVFEKQAIERIYSMLPKNSTALGKMNEYFQNNNPFERATHGSVTAEVTSALPTAADGGSWIIEWTETSRDLTGATVKTERYKSTYKVVQEVPTTEAMMNVNPLGMFVSDFDWTKVLG
jgi:type IV secretion system protein VirB5